MADPTWRITSRGKLDDRANTALSSAGVTYVSGHTVSGADSNSVLVAVGYGYGAARWTGALHPGDASPEGVRGRRAPGPPRGDPAGVEQ